VSCGFHPKQNKNLKEGRPNPPMHLLSTITVTKSNVIKLSFILTIGVGEYGPCLAIELMQ